MHLLKTKIDPSQSKTFIQKLILVDFTDRLIRPIQKLDAHYTTFNFSKDALPHRAFSLFLFDQQYNLLLQQRSSKKVTFPLLWTNTCCSHQQYHENEDDSLTKYQRSQYYVRKRTEEELNLDIKNIKLELVQKIIYSSIANETFSEYELDYIYFAKISEQTPQVRFNSDEVNQCKWLSRSELQQFAKQTNNAFTPWFDLIFKSHLLKWWQSYENNEEGYMNSEKIEKLN